MIPYAFHPEAEAEFADAALFYEARVAGLGRLFSAEVQRIIALIREYPDAGAPVRLPVRRILVDRFPSLLFTDAIESRFTFLPLRTCANARATRGADSSAPTRRSTGRPGTRLHLGERRRGPPVS